jgi:acyl carrier protein
MGVDAVRGEIAARVVAVAARVFELDEKALAMSDSPQTIDRWDSLHHLKLITATEAAFGIRLRMQAVLKIQDLAGLVAAVQSHQEE